MLCAAAVYVEVSADIDGLNTCRECSHVPSAFRIVSPRDLNFYVESSHCNGHTAIGLDPGEAPSNSSHDIDMASFVCIPSLQINRIPE